MEGSIMTEAPAGGDYDLAPGETLVPGSVVTGSASEEAPAPAPAEPAVESSSDAVVEEATEEAAPPAPEPDANTDI